MASLWEKIEEAMVAITFAEAGEHHYARQLLNKNKNGHKKVLLSTNCPLVTGKVLKHALNLSQRLGASLEVYQLFSLELKQSTEQLSEKKGQAKLNDLRGKLNKLGISYHYAVTDTTLMEELSVMARTRRDILAVVIPTCEANPHFRKRSRQTLSHIFKCPVILFDS